MRKQTRSSGFRVRFLIASAALAFATVLAALGIGLTSITKSQGFLPSTSPKLYTPFSNNTDNSDVPKVDFTVSVVCGGHVDCERGLRPLKIAIKHFESRFNVSFKIRNVYVTESQPKGTLEERWEEWFGIAENLGAAKNDLTVVLLEDFPDNIDTFDFEMEGIIGLASGIGVLGGPDPAGLLAKVMGSEQFMTRLLIHEIGHTLGAVHIAAGIMHPCACVNQYSDEFSLESTKEIKEHLARVALYRLLKQESGADQNKKSPAKIVISKDLVVREKIAPMCEKENS